ncbi:DUF5667 domain-containing protein [Nocardioides mesophilus]|uniref:DUF5667 domain-containing protein n=1 Tax=Nocardioides mesophilus TaxID=433659 RepID=A0A7G9R6M5_9ACTN|nr:DUF5667 domain-containing protein [Nocardioides mesophilus]QNN51250.1 hypothetical protein H9L09_11430 [Nocardioides mesophilus]
MTSLFSTRRRAEEFARAVDGVVLRPAVEPDPGLQPLLAVATALRSQAPAAPRADLVADLRARLLLEADEVLVPGAALVLPVRQRPRERRLAAAASVVIVLGSTAGVAVAAQSALPGDALYPVKRGIEQAQAGLSTSPAGKGRDLLSAAGDRLDEVEGLLAQDDPTSAPQIPGVLEDFTAQAGEGADLLLGSYAETRDPASVAAVRTFAADGITMLEQLSETAPPEAQDELAAAALALGDIDARAVQACSGCADLPELQVPPMFRAAADVDRTLARLSPTDLAGLDNSHPVVVQRGHTGTTEPDAPATGAAGGTDAATAPQGSTAGSGGDTSSGGALSGDTDVSKAGDDPVTKVKKTVEDTVDDTVDGVGGVVGDVTSGLGDATATLLPDPGTGDLLP